jgi:hypothetical protein
MKNAKADDQGTVPYENEAEKAVHYKSIEFVSDHAGQPFECVQRLYEIVLIRLKRQARVKDFLPILVAKRTKELINKRRALSKD